jgi:hypothetical protein
VRCDRSRATRERSIAVLIGALAAACATGVDPTGGDGAEGTGGAAASGASGGSSGVGSGGTGASSTTGGSAGIGGAGGVGGTGASGSGGTGGASATGGTGGSGTGGSGTGGSGTGGSATGGTGGSGTGGSGTGGTGGGGACGGNVNGSGGAAPTSGGLEVHYRRNDTNSTDDQLRFSLDVVNGGTDPVPLSEVTVRYWYTKDSGASAQTSNIDYAYIGGGNITRTFNAVGPVTGADFYVELSFTACAGTLAGGARTGDIQLRLNKDDYSAYSEADDYSYVDSAVQSEPRIPNDHITVYRDSTLVWGTEPQ